MFSTENSCKLSHIFSSLCVENVNLQLAAELRGAPLVRKYGNPSLRDN